MSILQDLKDTARLGRPQTPPPTQLSSLVKIAMMSRLFVLLAMAISCYIFPNHNPGDDAFSFSLRFPNTAATSTSSIGEQSRDACFCLQGQACENLETVFVFRIDSLSSLTTAHTDSTVCADATSIVASSHNSTILPAIYQFLLTPLTRWDASRFLDLAVYPSRRDPPRHLLQKRDHPEECYDHDDTNDVNVYSPRQQQQQSKLCDAVFLPTEQAHAFFPMLPFILRTVANSLVLWVPSSVLPPTYEGVTVLAALLWNTFCFVLAALALHDLTWTMTRQHWRRIEINDGVALAEWDPEKKRIPHDYCERLAYQTFLLFCFNPASVFFTTAYSESYFAMANFGGHALGVRIVLLGLVYRIEQNSHERKMQMTEQCLLTFLCVLPLWMAASFTRSNGSMNSCWLLLQGIGIACLWIPKREFAKAIRGLMQFSCLAFFVAFPVLLHDRMGYLKHCPPVTDNDSFVTPSWCRNSGSRFSLYGYVQRQHWNVGIFRYYTWKKIPNFLFATPILVLSILATMNWIHNSYNNFSVVQQRRGCENRNKVRTVIGWAVAALQTSVDYLSPEDGATADNQAPSSRVSANEMSISWIDIQLLAGSHMLAHYAVLAAVCIVGLLVAHIEITTRMICSSCPAIYWYMALCCCGTEENSEHGTKGTLWSNKRRIMGPFVLPYCFLYILVGVIMHPNWLPWT